MRPEVVKFIEAQARLTDAQAARKRAIAQNHEAERAFRKAWDALTGAEQDRVNKACVALLPAGVPTPSSD